MIGSGPQVRKGMWVEAVRQATFPGRKFPRPFPCAGKRTFLLPPCPQPCQGATGCLAWPGLVTIRGSASGPMLQPKQEGSCPCHTGVIGSRAWGLPPLP